MTPFILSVMYLLTDDFLSWMDWSRIQLIMVRMCCEKLKIETYLRFKAEEQRSRKSMSKPAIGLDSKWILPLPHPHGRHVQKGLFQLENEIRAPIPAGRHGRCRNLFDLLAAKNCILLNSGGKRLLVGQFQHRPIESNRTLAYFSRKRHLISSI